MKLIKLHNGTWIDAHEVDALEIQPARGLGSAHTKIRMKSGNEVLLFPKGSLRAGETQVREEIEDLAKRIQAVSA